MHPTWCSWNCSRDCIHSWSTALIYNRYLLADAFGDHALHQHVGQRLEVVREPAAVGVFAALLLDQHGQQSRVGPAQPGDVGRRFGSEKHATGQAAAPSPVTASRGPVSVRSARHAVGEEHSGTAVRAAWNLGALWAPPRQHRPTARKSITVLRGRRRRQWARARPLVVVITSEWRYNNRYRYYIMLQRNTM